MAEQASSFTRDWIAENIRNDPTKSESDIDEWTAQEVARLKDAARKAGLDLTDPELRDDLLREEIEAAIHNAYDPLAGGFRD